MMLVVVAVTALALYVAHRYVVAEARRNLQQDFESDLRVLHEVQALRNAAVSERVRALVVNPRIHAALEDNALDLLYPSAKDELRDLMQADDAANETGARVVHARFYRFLDSSGAVLHPPNPAEVGELTSEAEAALTLPKLPQSEQIGYLTRRTSRGEVTDELFASPIVSTETGEVISALVLGFKPLEVQSKSTGLTTGILINGALRLSTFPGEQPRVLAAEINRALASNPGEGNFLVKIDNVPRLLFYKWLNPGAVFPAAYEVCVYSLGAYDSWQRRLTLEIVAAGVALLIGGFIASHFIATRLATPVEKLARVSEENRTALESTSKELQRTARYSADASHQLKNPVTVLRAGLETLLARDDLKPEVYDELSSLVHQTYRLTGVIDDLLLLARVDAGRVQWQSQPVNLARLIEEWLDDLSALDESRDLHTATNLPPDLFVAGERRYTSLIVQNLLENARKYNRAGGKIDISAQKINGSVMLRVGNTGRGIAPDAQPHLFERFFRGPNHNGVSGHGLGLNLARELARLHGGDLRLVRAEEDWTEFEVRFQSAGATG